MLIPVVHQIWKTLKAISRKKLPSGLRRYIQNQKIPVLTPLGVWPGFKIQARNEAPGNLVKISQKRSD